MATVDLFPTGVVSGTWSVVGAADATTAVTDGSDSTWIAASETEMISFNFTDMPTDWLEVTAVTVTIRSSMVNNVDDTQSLYVGFYMGGGGSLTGEPRVENGSVYSIRDTVSEPFTFSSTYVADRTEWDNGVLRLRAWETQNMGDDGGELRVYAVKITMTYTSSGPTAPTASAVSGSQINLSWSAWPGATDYSLERSLDGSTGWTRINGTAPQTGTSYNNTGLSAATTYYYRVKATAGGADTQYSPVVSATTLNNLPLIEGFNTGSWPTSFEAAYESAPAVSDAVANASSVTLSGTASGGTWAITKYASAGTRQSARAKFKMSSTSTNSRLYLLVNSVAADSTTASSGNVVGSSCFAYVTGAGEVGAGFRESSSSGTTFLGPTSSVSVNTTDWFWAHFEAQAYDATYMYFRWKVWNANSPEPSTWDGDYLLACPVRSGRPGFGHIISSSITGSVEVDYFHAASAPQSGVSLSGSGTLSAVGQRTWPIIGYSPNANSTAYSNQRKIDRTSTGVLWAFFHPGASSTTMVCEPRYSTNGGVTWNPGDIAYNGSGSFTENYGRNLSVFIDQDDYAHLVFKDNGNGYIYYRRGTPNAGRTAWTWSAATTVWSASTEVDYADVVAHREGTGWVAHVVFSRNTSAFDSVYHLQIPIASNQTIGTTTQTRIGATAYGNTVHKYPSIDFNHTGGGKTVAGSTSHLYVAWSAGATGAGKGIRFKKATYSGGTWTWGTEREIDSTCYFDAVRTMQLVFDGTAVVIGGEGWTTTSPFQAHRLIERDAADTTTTTLFSENSNAAGVMLRPSLTYDSNRNLYVLGEALSATGYPLSYRKFTRLGSTYSSPASFGFGESGDAYVSVKRGYSSNLIEFIYTDGTGAPYPIRYGNIALGGSGSADLSGSGTLGFTGRPGGVGTGTFSGSGTLTVPTLVPRPVQTVQLSGSGTLTLARGPVGVVQSAALSGAGTLTIPARTATPIQTVQLSGSGTLTLIGQQQEFGSAALSGSGTLGLTRGPVTVTGATVGLSGSGTLTVPTRVVGTQGTGALSGAGTLSLTPVVGFARSGVLSGAGTLTLSWVAKPIQTVQLSGAGTLTPVRGPVAVFQSASLSGSGTLSLTRGPVTVSGTLGLSGSGTLTLVPVVGFTRAAALSGAGTLTFVARPSLQVTLALSGDGTLSLTKWFLFTANANGGTATGTGWVNPENATGADNGAYATWTTDVADAVSAPLIVSNFGTWSSIPAGSTIPKITVRVKGYVDHE